MVLNETTVGLANDREKVDAQFFFSSLRMTFRRDSSGALIVE